MTGVDKKYLVRQRKQDAMTALRKRLQSYPELRYLFFELTDKCNLDCLHCGSSCSINKGRFLNADKIVEVIRSVSAYEPRVHICLTGGEPLLHPGFQRIADELSKANLFWSVVTNATLVSEAVAKTLREDGVYSVSVSLDGPAGEHNKLRQSNTAYERAIHGINLLKRFDIPVQITTVVTKENIHSLDLLYKTVRKLGANSWKLINIEPIGRALEHEELLLDREDILYLLDYIRAKRKRTHTLNGQFCVTYGCSHFLPLQYEEEVRTNLFLCGAGILIAGVQSNGDIAACLDIERRKELVQGNIYHDNFIDVWEHRYQCFRRERTKKSSICGACEHRFVCAGDSMHTWDFDSDTPRLCLMRL